MVGQSGVQDRQWQCQIGTTRQSECRYRFQERQRTSRFRLPAHSAGEHRQTFGAWNRRQRRALARNQDRERQRRTAQGNGLIVAIVPAQHFIRGFLNGASSLGEAPMPQSALGLRNQLPNSAYFYKRPATYFGKLSV